MAYKIQEVDISDIAVEQELIALYTMAFAMPGGIETGLLGKIAHISADSPGFILAAIENEQIIGVSMFIYSRFMQEGEERTGYQSSWLATHPAYQGKGISVSIINQAKAIVRERGGNWIFAVGSPTSKAIFLNKLHFKALEGLMIKIPGLAIVRSRMLANGYIGRKPAQALLYEPDNIRVKKLVHGDNLHVFCHGESLLWGRYEKKTKFSVTLPYFYIGGMDIKEQAAFRILLDKLFKNRFIAYCQVVLNAGHRYETLIKGWSAAEMPFIYFNTKEDGQNIPDLMYGAIDVF